MKNPAVFFFKDLGTGFFSKCRNSQTPPWLWGPKTANPAVASESQSLSYTPRLAPSRVLPTAALHKNRGFHFKNGRTLKYRQAASFCRCEFGHGYVVSFSPHTCKGEFRRVRSIVYKKMLAPPINHFSVRSCCRRLLLVSLFWSLVLSDGKILNFNSRTKTTTAGTGAVCDLQT